MRDFEERAVGVLLGLAAGDRIGGPLRMGLRVAESLRDRGGLEVSDGGRRYLDGWREAATGAGPTVAGVRSPVASGDPSRSRESTR